MADERSVKAQSIFAPIAAPDLAKEFAGIPALASISPQALRQLGELEIGRIDRDADLFTAAQGRSGFWALLSGHLRLFRIEEDGANSSLGDMRAGDTFGEVPLLLGKRVKAKGTALEPSLIVYFTEDAFWKVVACCPAARAAILGNAARRFELYQYQTLHRQKLIALGTLAAGLMHELNNPGAAARRATAQLRENLIRLQFTSLRICSGERKTAGQMECLLDLQRQAVEFKRPKATGSLEQSDAEERLSEWLEKQGIENAWKLAPTLSAIGLDAASLSCAQQEFPGSSLSDPLNWVEALISSMQLVGAIEESISRVTELVMAVKKYGYEDKAERHEVDVHDGIQSTLIVLGHKFRQKQLAVVKRFAACLPKLSTCGRGLNQVWTNLLDNAIDAAPEKGSVEIRSWEEGSSVCVGIRDNGPGIPKDRLQNIFEPFYTTKPVGEGTGLGLDIVQRIVAQFGGTITVESEPGNTEFVVRLPVNS